MTPKATIGRLLLLCLLIIAPGACQSAEPGVVELAKLKLSDEDERLSDDGQTVVLPPLGAELFLVVTDLGTCLECKKAAISVSNAWQNKGRPGALVYLETMRTEFDRQATADFIKEKKLRGLHYLCDEDCVEKLTIMLGEKPAMPSNYFIGTKGLIHWKAGYLDSYGAPLKAIRKGKHDVPLSVKTE